MMNAVLWTNYGPPSVLKYQKIPKPVPSDTQILVKIKTSSVFVGDCEMRGLYPPLVPPSIVRLFIGLTKPKRITILGQEFSGIVESIGSKVTSYKPNDEVFGTSGLAFGTYAEYVCFNPDDKFSAITKKPEWLSHEEAVSLPIGTQEAYWFLNRVGIKPNDKVLIIGGGGQIGSYAVQIAKAFGADVTAVDHTTKQDLMKKLGADTVIDYTTQDFTTSGKYDVVFDCAGKSTSADCKKCLTTKGKLLIGTATWGQIFSTMSSDQIFCKTAQYSKEGLEKILELVKEGKVKPVIDERKFKLEEMEKAHEYVESGLKRGVVIASI